MASVSFSRHFSVWLRAFSKCSVSSSAATLGSAHEYVHYAAAKAGVDALVVGLAKELADDGVRVNAVAPGLVRTGIHAGAGDAGRLGADGHVRVTGSAGPRPC